MNYERMFASAVVCLAEITEALKIPPEVASVATGSSEILAAIREKDERITALEKEVKDLRAYLSGIDALPDEPPRS